MTYTWSKVGIIDDLPVERAARQFDPRIVFLSTRPLNPETSAQVPTSWKATWPTGTKLSEIWSKEPHMNSGSRTWKLFRGWMIIIVSAEIRSNFIQIKATGISKTLFRHRWRLRSLIKEDWCSRTEPRINVKAFITQVIASRLGPVGDYQQARS